jgi:hypothetical protein
VIGQQVKNAITLAPNGNIKEGMQVNVEVGEKLLLQMSIELKLSCRRLLTLSKTKKL